MNNVYLVYEDDYGGLFSPYVLTQVFASKKEAEIYVKERKNSRILERENNGMEISNYPYYHGGKYSDD